MLRLGDDQAAMGVLDVAEEVLTAAGVVQPDHRGARKRGAAEREEVLGHVVEEDRDVRRPAGRQPVEQEVRPAAGLRHVLAVGPDPVLEAQRGPRRNRRIGRVAAQECRRVRGRQRRLPRCRHLASRPRLGT